MTRFALPYDEKSVSTTTPRARFTPLEASHAQTFPFPPGTCVLCRENNFNSSVTAVALDVVDAVLWDNVTANAVYQLKGSSNLLFAPSQLSYTPGTSVRWRNSRTITNFTQSTQMPFPTSEIMPQGHHIPAIVRGVRSMAVGSLYRLQVGDRVLHNVSSHEITRDFQPNHYNNNNIIPPAPATASVPNPYNNNNNNNNNNNTDATLTWPPHDFGFLNISNESSESNQSNTEDLESPLTVIETSLLNLQTIKKDAPKVDTHTRTLPGDAIPATLLVPPELPSKSKVLDVNPLPGTDTVENGIDSPSSLGYLLDSITENNKQTTAAPEEDNNTTTTTPSVDDTENNPSSTSSPSWATILQTKANNTVLQKTVAAPTHKLVFVIPSFANLPKLRDVWNRKGRQLEKTHCCTITLGSVSVPTPNMPHGSTTTTTKTKGWTIKSDSRAKGAKNPEALWDSLLQVILASVATDCSFPDRRSLACHTVRSNPQYFESKRIVPHSNDDTGLAWKHRDGKTGEVVWEALVDSGVPDNDQLGRILCAGGGGWCQEMMAGTDVICYILRVPYVSIYVASPDGKGLTEKVIQARNRLEWAQRRFPHAFRVRK